MGIASLLARGLSVFIAKRQAVLAGFAFTAVFTSCFRQKAQDDEAFTNFKEKELWPKAQAAGVTRSTFEKHASHIPFSERTIDIATQQPEHLEPLGSFIESRIKGRLETGRQLQTKWQPWLETMECRYNVDPEIVMAIWGLESRFGKQQGDFQALRSLTSLAFAGPRKDHAMQETIQLLLWSQETGNNPTRWTSSFAGAMGQCQFLPSSLKKYGQDGDEDGQIDIWNNNVDALASIANYLSQNGWEPHQPWGFIATKLSEEKLRSALTSPTAPLKTWLDQGIRPADGRDLSALSHLEANIVMPAGRDGPVIVTLPNYHAIKSYNGAKAYVLTVGMLADRLKDPSTTSPEWPLTGKKDKLTSNDVRYVQTELHQRNLYNKTIDGIPGDATEQAIKADQIQRGLLPDGALTRDYIDGLMRQNISLRQNQRRRVTKN